MMERKTFPGILDSLDDIRQVVKEASQQAGLAKKPAYHLMLAVDEIAANIIMYGYEATGIQGTVDVLTELTEAKLTITLEDDAPAFDPLQREMPTEETFDMPLEERQIGGMGIYLTVNGVDEFRYELVNNRNRNTFIMKTDNVADTSK